jgi:uncharacterized protein with HEPN domain
VTRREELRLRDILRAIETVRAYAAEGEFDQRTTYAVLYNLVVIGEAAAQLSEETRARASNIPWTKVVGLRNLIAHEYFRIDLEIIETIVREQLDELGRTVEDLLANS